MTEVVSSWIQSSPAGDLFIACTDIGISRLDFRIPKEAPSGVRDEAVAKTLDDYLAGNLSAIDSLSIDLDGVTPFRRDVIEALRLIPQGETMTYGELATKLGVKSARAIGQAVGSNPVAIVSPCHRVVAADGTLGGYSGGLDNKRWLLAHEGVAPREGGWVSRAEKRIAMSA